MTQTEMPFEYASKPAADPAIPAADPVIPAANQAIPAADPATSAAQRPVLLVIDGMNFIYRAYYATKMSKPMTAPAGSKRAGLPTGTILAFTNMVARIIRTFKPAYAVMAFDVGKKNWRHDRFEDYKATRKPMPEDLKPQIEPIKEIARAFGMPIIGCEGFEADDVIATLAKLCVESGLDMYAATGDKDLMAVVNDNVKLLGKDDLVIGIPEVFEKFGVTPKRVPDVLALWGDSSDNIPGVPGFGEEKAIKHIQEFGSLDELLARADEVKGKLGEKLRANFQQAMLSFELATVIDCIPYQQLNFSFDEARFSGPDTAALQGLFDEFGFSSLNALTILMDPDEKKRLKKAQKEQPPELPPHPVEQFLEKPAATVVSTPLGGTLFTFGKHRGKSVDEVAASHPRYLSWLLEEAPNISAELRQAVTEALAAV